MRSAMMLPPRKTAGVNRVPTSIQKDSAFSSIAEDAASPYFRSTYDNFRMINLPYVEKAFENYEGVTLDDDEAVADKVKKKSLFL